MLDGFASIDTTASLFIVINYIQYKFKKYVYGELRNLAIHLPRAIVLVSLVVRVHVLVILVVVLLLSKTLAVEQMD